MKLLKFVVVAFVFTILALVYIHLQVQIYDLGYKGEFKKTELQKQNDINGYLSYNISRLKSANHLGVKLLGNHSEMQFLDNNHVVKIKTPAGLLKSESALSLRDKNKAEGLHRQNLLAGVFSLRSQAEAGSIK